MTSKIKLRKFNRCMFLFAAGLLLMTSVSSAALAPLLSSSETPVIAGQTTEFDVYFHNEGPETLTTIIPRQLQFLASLENGSERLLSAVGLGSAEITTTLAPGGYYKKRDIVKVPADMQGVIHYKLGDFLRVQDFCWSLRQKQNRQRPRPPS